jgi:hypothetical protein
MDMEKLLTKEKADAVSERIAKRLQVNKIVGGAQISTQGMIPLFMRVRRSSKRDKNWSQFLGLCTVSFRSPKRKRLKEEVWTELQKNQLRLSSNSRQVIASGSGHGIPWERPDAVISAVQSIVQSWRLSNPQIN